MKGNDSASFDATVGGEVSSSETIRIVLADDHAVVRSGLRMLLDCESDFEVVADASNIEDARRYVRGHHPKVLVLDLNMPGGSSLEAIPAIREESPDTEIVMLTMQQDRLFRRRRCGGPPAAGSSCCLRALL
jgi:two-component system response regulator NreC